MNLTFVDSGVLIAAFRASDRTGKLALEILDDPQRDFASSIFVKLETIPKPAFLKREEEHQFYERFFRRVSKWATIDVDLTASALDMGSTAGLSAMDALHLAAAHQMRCDEFVTTEKVTKPLHRTSLFRIKSIH
jgi:hypothetical protein